MPLPMAEPSSLCYLNAKALGESILFRVFSFLFRVFSISFRVFSFLEDWYSFSRVGMSEPEWRVHGRRSLEVGPLSEGALVVGWGARQEEWCWSPRQEGP